MTSAVGERSGESGEGPAGEPSGRSWRVFRPGCFAGLTLLALAAAVLAACLSYRPAFYAPRPDDADPRREQAAGRLVTRGSALGAAIGRPGRWEGVFTDDEINAWFDVDLPRNHPKLLPANMSRPHVRFAARRVEAGIRVGFGVASAVAWADLEIVLREVNVISVAVEGAGLGLVPLPEGVVLRAIAGRIAAQGVVTEFRRIDGRTVLMLYIPPVRSDSGLNYRLEGLRIDVGEAVIEGMTRGTQPVE